MSDTKRKTPYTLNKFFRSPKRNIMPKDIDNARQKSIPPNSYDDIHFNHENSIIFSIIRRLKQKKFSHQDIAWRLTKKFKISYNNALISVKQFNSINN